MDLTRVEFDGAKRTIVFHGNCSEMLAVCQAMCCREWVVGISAEEYATGQYEAEVICVLTDKLCHAATQPCVNRKYQLTKHMDKSCVYLEDNRCRIYAERPQVCREFLCQGGWQLTSILPANSTSRDQKPHTLTLETFVEKLTDDAIFVQQPLLKLHTVFYLKPKRKIIFVKELVGACGKFYTRDDFDYPQLDDAQLLMLIELFNRKEPLREVYRSFCSQSANKLTQQEFYAIVWLLNKHNIVLDSRNFQGMLGGMGGQG
jgi:Fe-S-cluster containining protein